MQNETDNNLHPQPDHTTTSKDPCCDTNPCLWTVFCVFTGRDNMSVSPYWTEQDVVNNLVLKGLEYRDIKSASHRS